MNGWPGSSCIAQGVISPKNERAWPGRSALAPHMADRQAGAVITNECEKWAEKIFKKSGATEANNFLRRMQTIYNKPWGRRRAERVFISNPAQHVDRFPVDRRAKYVPTLAEVDRIRAAAGGEFGLYLEILLETAARPSEALNLAWADIRPDTITLYTKKTATGGRVPRFLEISEDLSRRFQSWRKKQGRGLLVFAQDGQADLPRGLTWANKQHRAACQRAEIKFFPVSCYRHFRASLWARQHVPLTTIQTRLGHRQATTTNNYLRELGV